MHALLAAHGDDGEIAALVALGLHHEQQHQELILTDIKHALSRNPLAPAYARRWPMAPVRPQPLAWFDHDGGLVELGHDARLDGDFCFDNETPRHLAYAAPFELASRPVSYGEYLEFINDGGYRRAELWLSMGWDWVRGGQRRAPLYWRETDGVWMHHTLQGHIEIERRAVRAELQLSDSRELTRWIDQHVEAERRMRLPVPA